MRVKPFRRPRREVELVRLIKVRSTTGGWNRDRGFTGEGPSIEGGVDKVRAPGGAMARHKEGDGGVGSGPGIGGEVDS